MTADNAQTGGTTWNGWRGVAVVPVRVVVDDYGDAWEILSTWEDFEAHRFDRTQTGRRDA